MGPARRAPRPCGQMKHSWPAVVYRTPPLHGQMGAMNQTRSSLPSTSLSMGMAALRHADKAGDRVMPLLPRLRAGILFAYWRWRRAFPPCPQFERRSGPGEEGRRGQQPMAPAAALRITGPRPAPASPLAPAGRTGSDGGKSHCYGWARSPTSRSGRDGGPCPCPLTGPPRRA